VRDWRFEAFGDAKGPRIVFTFGVLFGRESALGSAGLTCVTRPSTFLCTPKERYERKAPQALCTCAIRGCSDSRLFRHKARRAGKACCLHQRRNTGAGQPGVALRVGWCAPMAALRRVPRAQAIAFTPLLALNAHKPTAVANGTGAECYALSLRANLERTPRHGAPQALALLAKPARAASLPPDPAPGRTLKARPNGNRESKQNGTQTAELRISQFRAIQLQTRLVLTFGPPLIACLADVRLGGDGRQDAGQAALRRKRMAASPVQGYVREVARRDKRSRGCVSFAGFFAHSKKSARARHLGQLKAPASNRARNRPP